MVGFYINRSSWKGKEFKFDVIINFLKDSIKDMTKLLLLALLTVLAITQNAGDVVVVESE